MENQGNWIPQQTNGIIPTKRFGHSAVVYKNAIYCFGGVTTAPTLYTTTDAFEEFEFATNSWKRIDNQGTFHPKERFAHSAVIFQDSIFIFAGKDIKGNVCNDILQFNFANRRWNEIQSKGILPSPRYGHTSIVKGNSMFVFGGADNHSETLGDLQRFNFETNEWILVKADGTAPSRRLCHCACLFKDGRTESMFIFGGCYGSQEFNDIHKYEFDTNTWTLLNTSGTTPPELAGSSMAVYGSCIYFFGGYYRSGKNSNELYQFEVDQCKWTKLEIKRCPTARSSSSMIVNQDCLWMTGGQTLNELFNDLWKFELGYSILE